MKKELELRMYFFTIYQLSGIQKGIQAGHAALEYARLFGNSDLFKEFVSKWKTWVILNGGTTNDDSVGTINDIENILISLGVNYAAFREPDLNNALTSLCIICDERVFNRRDYPDYIEYPYNSNLTLMVNDYDKWVDSIGGETNKALRELISRMKLA